MNYSKAYEVYNGLLVINEDFGNTTDGPFLTGGPSLPFGLNLPTNTFYVQTDMDGITLWRKYGNGTNDWLVHDNVTKVKNIDYDIFVPSQNRYNARKLSFNKELVIDGEVYIS